MSKTELLKKTCTRLKVSLVNCDVIDYTVCTPAAVYWAVVTSDVSAH